MKKQKGFNIVLKIMAVILSLGIVIGCMNTEPVQAAKKSSGTTYYATLLNHKRGGRSGNSKYWLPGTTKVTYNKNSVTFYGSFSKAKKIPFTYSKKNFQKYGKAAGVSAKDMEKERGKLREKMSTVDKKLSAKNAAPKKSHKQLTAKDLHIGDSIKVLSLNLKGTVSTLPDAKGNLFVQMGILRSQVNIRDLEKLDDTVITGGNFSKTGSGKIKMSKSASVSTEINLLGKTVDEAIMELDKYLDDAYIAHLPSVRIVHGKGTGALRKGVHNYLRRQKHVKSYRLGEFGEGDAGVTIVEFK